MEMTTPVLTIEEIERRVKRLHPGDMVEMPSDLEDGETMIATVSRIYKNYVEFKKENGMITTLGYFDAMDVNIIKPAGFESYSREMAMNDIAGAFKNKR